MSTYILVHGSWHGAWCWYKIVSRLEEAGHTVIAVDLPSLGMDRTPISEVTLELWTQSVCDVLDAQNTPSILVGHSRGGIVISQAAEQRPEKVEKLVYLTAFLLRDGELLMDVQGLENTALSKAMIFSENNDSATLDKKAVKNALYDECPAEDVALARLLLAPEATMPLSTPIHITEENYGHVPRYYIECLRDKAMLPAVQKNMYTALPCKKVLSIDTDHSPFFSRPEELVACLLEP